MREASLEKFTDGKTGVLCNTPGCVDRFLPVVGALRAKCIGGKVRTVSDVPTEALQPCQGGLFDVGFCEDGQGVSTSAAWISFNDRPSASFHSLRPLLGLPNRTPAAVEGEVKVWFLTRQYVVPVSLKISSIQQRLPQIGKKGVDISNLVLDRLRTGQHDETTRLFITVCLYPFGTQGQLPALFRYSPRLLEETHPYDRQT